MIDANMNNLPGDVRLLAMAVQALIETHPNKTAFHKTFLTLIDDVGPHSLYSPKGLKPFDVQLLRDILRTAVYNSKVDSAPPNDQTD